MKTIYAQLLSCLFLAMLTSFIPGTGIAQSKSEDCKPLKRANRNKSWQYQSYSVLESEYHADGSWIRRMHLGKADSIYVYDASGTLVNAFRCDRDGRILDPVRLNYANEGHFLSDSIIPGMGGFQNWYFNGHLYSEAVRLTEDRQGGTKRYYDSKGKDSLWSVHITGRLRLMTWYRNGKDSLQRRWDEQGRLEYEKDGHSELIWDASQRLVQRSFDTLIRDKNIKCTKTWYPTGILSSVTYHYLWTPCLTWKYYDEKGKLIQRIRKEDPDKIMPLGVGASSKEIFRNVEELEDVKQQLNQQLNHKLAELLCRTQVTPNGSYLLRVRLDASGKFTLRDMQGAYADIIKPEMETIFRELTGAKPAKRNGRNYARLLQVTLEVKAK